MRKTDRCSLGQEIVIAPYMVLAVYYEKFIAHGFTSAEKSQLESIFNYDGYDDRIARFFVDHADDLNLHSCFYCETAYVNAYTVSSINKKHFDIDHVLPKKVSASRAIIIQLCAIISGMQFKDQKS